METIQRDFLTATSQTNKNQNNMNTKSFIFEADNRDSYIGLSTILSTTYADVALFPKELTATMTVGENDEDDYNEVIKKINENGMHVTVSEIRYSGEILGMLIDSPVTDPATLHKICKTLLEQKLEEGKKYNAIFKDYTEQNELLEKKLKEKSDQCSRYFDYWSAETKKLEEVKASVRAMAVLMNAIYSEDKTK